MILFNKVLIGLTCSLGGKVERLLWLTESKEVLRHDLGLVLRGGAELGEESAALPRAAALGVNTGLTRGNLELAPLVLLGPGLEPVEDPEAGDLSLALGGPGQGVAVRVQRHGRAGEHCWGGEA